MRPEPQANWRRGRGRRDRDVAPTSAFD